MLQTLQQLLQDLLRKQQKGNIWEKVLVNYNGVLNPMFTKQLYTTYTCVGFICTTKSKYLQANSKCTISQTTNSSNSQLLHTIC